MKMATTSAWCGFQCCACSVTCLCVFDVRPSICVFSIASAHNALLKLEAKTPQHVVANREVAGLFSSRHRLAPQCEIGVSCKLGQDSLQRVENADVDCIVLHSARGLPWSMIHLALRDEFSNSNLCFNVIFLLVNGRSV